LIGNIFLNRILDLLEEFTSLANKIPISSEELFELMDLLDKKMKEVISLELPLMLENLQNRIIDFIQFNIFTQEDQIENAKIFEWAEKIPKIYKEHLSIIEDKRQIFKANLNVYC
jgi:hypothetical protein